MAVFKLRNTKTGQATPIPPGEFSVGRADDAYVHVEDPSVSRRHAQIINNAAGFFVDDLGSANGTALRGAFISRRMNINYGDVVYIGSVPFRIDHEIEGEVDAAPSAGTRTVNRAYMRRDTERLPNPGEAPRVVEQIAPENLSAPVVSEADDVDAGDLNAVTMTEPETASVQAEDIPAKEPEAHPVREVAPMRSSFSVPTPQRQLQPQLSQPGKAAAMQAQFHQPSASTPVPAQAAAPSRGWSWFLLVFLAGMGTGLLLGLYFAKLFIEMGGKAASLP